MYVEKLLTRLEKELAATFGRRMRFGIGPVRENKAKVTLTPQYWGTPRGELMATLTLTDSQSCPLSVAFVDAAGNPAVVDGAPQWLTGNSEILALAPAADGLSCVVNAAGPLGTATVSVSADADLGSGSTTISGSLDVTVIAGAAVTVDITAGTPV